MSVDRVNSHYWIKSPFSYKRLINIRYADGCKGRARRRLHRCECGGVIRLAGVSNARVRSGRVASAVLRELAMVEPKSSRASAQRQLTFADRTTELPILTMICNAILRDFGYSVDTTALQKALQ